MTPSDWNIGLQIAGGAVGLGLSVWGWLKLVWPRYLAWAARHEEWQEAMRQLPAALRKIQAIDALAESISEIRHAVLPNKGSSIPDSILNLLAFLKVVQAGIQEGFEQRAQLAKDLATVSHTIRANQNANPNIAGFECRPDGRLLSVTKTYTRWTGVETSDLLGWNWVNTIHPDDKIRVRAEFMSAVSDVRNCTVRYRMINLSTGVAEEVEMTLTSIPENTSPCERFVGSIYRINHVDNP